jgi:hypothetical protein
MFVTLRCKKDKSASDLRRSADAREELTSIDLYGFSTLAFAHAHPFVQLSSGNGLRPNDIVVEEGVWSDGRHWMLAIDSRDRSFILHCGYSSTGQSHPTILGQDRRHISMFAEEVMSEGLPPE